MDRLKAYRLVHGLGCWTAVAKASGGKLSEDQLRDMAAGSVALPIGEWRLADKALDKLGAHIARYYATEIDKYAIKTTQHNYPETIQLGDAFQVRDDGWHL